MRAVAVAALGDDSYEDDLTCFDEDDLTCRERGKGQPHAVARFLLVPGTCCYNIDPWRKINIKARSYVLNTNERGFQILIVVDFLFPP